MHLSVSCSSLGIERSMLELDMVKDLAGISYMDQPLCKVLLSGIFFLTRFLFLTSSARDSGPNSRSGVKLGAVWRHQPQHARRTAAV
jgi:hypothetical protein